MEELSDVRLEQSVNNIKFFSIIGAGSKNEAEITESKCSTKWNKTMLYNIVSLHHFSICF